MSKRLFNNRLNQYVKLTVDQERYIRIYHSYFVLHWTSQEICEYYKCCKSTVSIAVRWVIDNKLKFPTKHLIEGAIDTISYRLKKNQELLDHELNKSRNKDKLFIIALNKEIREDEKSIYKMMEIITDKDDADSGINAADVLKLITSAQQKK